MRMFEPASPWRWLLFDAELCHRIVWISCSKQWGFTMVQRQYSWEQYQSNIMDRKSPKSKNSLKTALRFFQVRLRDFCFQPIRTRVRAEERSGGSTVRISRNRPMLFPRMWGWDFQLRQVIQIGFKSGWWLGLLEWHGDFHKWGNVVKTINQLFGISFFFYNLFIVIWGMVYYCFDHITQKGGIVGKVHL